MEGDDAGCAEDAELKHHVETGQMDPLDQWGMDDLKMLRKNHRQPRKMEVYIWVYDLKMLILLRQMEGNSMEDGDLTRKTYGGFVQFSLWHYGFGKATGWYLILREITIKTW